MKTSHISSLIALGALTLTSITFAQDDRVGTVSPPPGGTTGLPLPPSGVANRLKQYSFAQRAEFVNAVHALSTQTDNTWAAMSAGYIEMEASAPRRSAMEFLRTAQADFKDKVSALDNITPDTWETVKANAIASWDRYEQALLKARSITQ